MHKILFFIFVIIGITLYLPKTNATKVESETESQASIRFIKGNTFDKTNENEESIIVDIDVTKKNTVFPKTGKRQFNYIEGIGFLSIGLMLLLIKIKK